MRKPLEFGSFSSAIQDMIENNAFTAAIIDELIEKYGESISLTVLIILDDMNIRGAQISELYKLCDQNIENFYKKIININPDDIEKLNQLSASICQYKAIFNGSSEKRQANPSKYLFTENERSILNSKKHQKNTHENKDIIQNTNIPEDLYPTIDVDSALALIQKKGFTCGFKKSYFNFAHQKEVYRIFYNKLGDIIYTHSLDEENIFLWGSSKLNVVRRNKNNKEIGENNSNAYINVSNVVGYNIELKEKPFTSYKEILAKKEPTIDDIKASYYDNNLIPIVETIKGIKHRQKYNHYHSCAAAMIYDLLTFNEIYFDLDDGLQKIYKPLLNWAVDKAYDEIIAQLNSDEGIEIATEVQDMLGVCLDKNKLFAAKERYCEAHGHYEEIPKTKFVSNFLTDNSWGKDINDRIVKILKQKIDEK